MGSDLYRELLLPLDYLDDDDVSLPVSISSLFFKNPAFQAFAIWYSK